MRAARALWLTAPTRFAELRRDQARAVLAIVAGLLFAVMTALVTPALSRPGVDTPELPTAENIVERVRHGEPYYPVAADELRRADQPLHPSPAVPLPALTLLLATLPPRWRVVPLTLLAGAVLLVWARRLRGVFSRRAPVAIALLLLAAGTLANVNAERVTDPALWAGLFIALSLGVRRAGQRVAPVAFGLCAMLAWPSAALYAALMAATAWGEGERREVAGWLAAFVLVAGILAAHAHAVAGVLRPTDPAWPGLWGPSRLGIHGNGLFVRAIVAGTGLRLLPSLLAVPLVGFSLAGWTAWRDALATRVTATLAGFALLIAIIAPAEAAGWALLVAPVSLVGLAFVPDAARDLVRAAFGRRRITVTRLAR